MNACFSFSSLKIALGDRSGLSWALVNVASRASSCKCKRDACKATRDTTVLRVFRSAYNRENFFMAPLPIFWMLSRPNAAKRLVD